MEEEDEDCDDERDVELEVESSDDIGPPLPTILFGAVVS